MPSSVHLRDSSVDALRGRPTGRAFLPGDPGYSQECSTYNLVTPLRPRVAIGAETEADVAAAIRFAADNGLGVAIRDGGHIAARRVEDIVVVNTSRMRTVSVDADARQVRFGTSTLWQDVLDGVTPLGLAPMNA